MEYAFVILIILIACCEVMAQSCANYASHEDNYLYVFLGGMFYTVLVYFLSRAHKTTPMGIVNAIWGGVSVVAIASTGYFWFGQKLRTDQVAMMGVIAVGIAYLAVSAEEKDGDTYGG